MVSQVVSILEDDTMQEGFMTEADVRGEGSSRVRGEMNTGDWWEETEKEAPVGSVVVPLIVYIDETWLSKGGGHACCPISMTIGNLPRAVMNKSSAKRVSCNV